MTTSDLDRACQQLNARLDEVPWCLETRSILADLYEDMGELDCAAFQRWLVRANKRPFCPRLEKHKFPNITNTFGDGRWHFYACAERNEQCFVPYQYEIDLIVADTRAEAEEIVFLDDIWRAL